MMQDAVIDFLLHAYPYLKVVHLLALISWMAGMFYFPRLLVYHAENKHEEACSRVFSVMEQRLMKVIMNPAMILTFISGLALVSVPGVLQAGASGWFHLKFVAVIAMAGCHGYFSQLSKTARRDVNAMKSSRFYRYVNEVPTILLIIIIFSVVIKPF